MQHCLDKCNANKECKWVVYNPDYEICFFYKRCRCVKQLDNYCQNCVTSKRECGLPAPLSTTTTSPSTTCSAASTCSLPIITSTTIEPTEPDLGNNISTPNLNSTNNSENLHILRTNFNHYHWRP